MSSVPVDMLRGAVERGGGVPRAAHGRQEALRRHIDEWVGLTFFGTLLKQMRSAGLKGPLGHSSGEEIFRGQLHFELARRAGRAMRFGLNEAIYRQLARGSGLPAGGEEVSG